MFTLQACSRKVIMLHSARTGWKRHFNAGKLFFSSSERTSSLIKTFFLFYPSSYQSPHITKHFLPSERMFFGTRTGGSREPWGPGIWRLGVQYNSSVSCSSSSIFVALDATSRIQRGAKWLWWLQQWGHDEDEMMRFQPRSEIHSISIHVDVTFILSVMVPGTEDESTWYCTK